MGPTSLCDHLGFNLIFCDWLEKIALFSKIKLIPGRKRRTIMYQIDLIVKKYYDKWDTKLHW